MNLGTVLFIVFCVLYFKAVMTRLIFRAERRKHIKTRIKLNELRNKSNKTIEEQKQFLDLKYPKSPPKKLTFFRVIKFVAFLIMMVCIFLAIKTFWNNYIQIVIPLWFTVLFAVFFPMLINMLLKKFKLDDDDLSVFFK